MRWCLFPFFLNIVFTRLLKETQNKILRDICNFARTTNRWRGFHLKTPFRVDRNHYTGAKVIHYYNTYSRIPVNGAEVCLLIEQWALRYRVPYNCRDFGSIPLLPPPSSIFFCLRSIILCYSIIYKYIYSIPTNNNENYNRGRSVYIIPFVFHPFFIAVPTCATAGHRLDQRRRRRRRQLSNREVIRRITGKRLNYTVYGFLGYFTRTHTGFKHEVTATATAELVCHTKPKRKKKIPYKKVIL